MRRKLFIVIQWIFAIAVVVYAAIVLRRQWTEIHTRLGQLRVEPVMLIGASLIVFLAYAVLIETWRRVLSAWDTRLRWAVAARIWFASSLAKYIPGNIWSIAALGVMSREQGASPVAAAGSSIIVNALNLAAGLAVVLVFGSRLIPHATVFAVIAAAAIAVALAAPWILPTATAWASRVLGRAIPLPRIPPSTTWWSLGGTTFAWCAYGVAFRMFAVAVLGDSAVHGSFVLYIAAYTAAYIVGFVAPFAPAGLGVREVGITEGLPLLGLMSHGDAFIIALTSRLWLTLLEVIPGLVALAAGHTRTRARPA